MRRDLDLFRGIFEDMWGLEPHAAGAARALAPACDVEESEDHYLIALDMPGVDKKEIKIEVTADQLTVTAERRSERAEKNRTRHLSERSFGRFQRTFQLPSQIDSDKIEARVANGVLQIAVPKSEAVKPRQIPVGEEKSGGFFARFTGRNEKTEAESAKSVKEIHAA